MVRFQVRDVNGDSHHFLMTEETSHQWLEQLSTVTNDNEANCRLMFDGKKNDGGTDERGGEKSGLIRE